MKQETKQWALLMLANELASEDYVGKYGDYSQNEEDDFVMTDEVEAVMNLVHHKETLDKVHDLQLFITDFFEKAQKAGWELPWESGDELLAVAEAEK